MSSMSYLPPSFVLSSGRSSQAIFLVETVVHVGRSIIYDALYFKVPLKTLSPPENTLIRLIPTRAERALNAEKKTCRGRSTRHLWYRLHVSDAPSRNQPRWETVTNGFYFLCRILARLGGRPVFSHSTAQPVTSTVPHSEAYVLRLHQHVGSFRKHSCEMLYDLV